MQPCSTCRTKTEYREKLPGGKFFCKPQCQRKHYYELSGIEDDDDDDDDNMIVEDVEKRPEFFGEKLSQSLNDFFQNSVVEKIDKVSKELNKLLMNLYWRIRVLRLHLDLVEGHKRLKQLRHVLKGVKKEQADFSSSSSNERVIMAIYSEYIRERYLEIDSLLVMMAMMRSEKDLLQGELPNQFLHDASPFQESLDHYLEYMEITQKYINNLKRKFPIFSAFYQQVLLGKEEAVEEITIERVEVKTGMTQEQQDVFDYVEELVIESEKVSKNCDFFVASYIKNCDVIMHLDLLSFLIAVISKKDPYLRNVFETGISLGSDLNNIESRVKEERKLFDSDVYDSLSPHDKVKYGTINWAHSRTGCNQTQGQFGNSYLIISPKVKKRCTYSRYDSVKSISRIRPYNLGTQETRMCYISNEFTKKQIESMYQYSGGENQMMNTIYDEDYMEVQIHGELLFSRDVAKIMIGPHHGDKKMYIEPLLREYFKIIGKDIPYEFI